MMRWCLLGVAGYAVLCFSPTQAADWKTSVKIKPYSISGSTGRELYRSIGENGPRLKGNRQTMALTEFDLKWRRNYQPKGQACTLLSAKPFFTIIYTLPKPARKLTGATARSWKRFYQGIKSHEEVHGQHAGELVQQIIDTTVGLRVENDSKCKKIRAEVLKRVKAAYRDYGKRSHVFDKKEMARGGNVRGLVHQLLRGR